MKNSFDIGSELSGCADVKTYVPGKRLRVYFAHPVTTYYSALEFECESFIRLHVGEVDIVNPNSPEHEREYQKLKILRGGQAMKYFTDLAETCDLCVFLPFLDKRIGAGVGKEIATFFRRFGEEARVYEYDTNEQQLIARNSTYFANPLRVMSVEETRERIAEYRKL